MADAILASMVRALLGNTASIIENEIAVACGAKEELNKLSRTLLRIHEVLNDAEEREIKDKAVKLWLRDLRNAAYDCDDILDEFATHVQQKKLGREAPSNTRKQVRKFLSCIFLDDVKLQYNIGRRIRAVRERLDEISKERHAFHLGEGGGHVLIHSRELQTSSLIDEWKVFGREDEKEKIIELLISDECGRKDISVISIVGMGGIGKTTLAQLVYNDERVEMNFEIRIWVCVSEDFDVRRITKAIIESITRNSSELMELDLLQTALEEKLRSRRFLLVLDDVWNENHSNWDLLQIPFRVGAQGSKIIVTTRSEIVSSIMGAIYINHLEGLSSSQCWSLFAQHAFPRDGLHRNHTLEEIGREIVNKCNGLPLAVKTLGCLLQSKADEKGWDGILKSEIWDLPEHENNILPALRLSYHHLPTPVKQCFAYCSIFPKGYGFEKEKLVQLWMAEGFIQMKGRKQMEDIGGEYFDNLLSRSFLQYSHTDWEDRPINKMHYLIHDLAAYISGKECFRIENYESCNIIERARHSSLLHHKDDLKNFQDFYKCKSLRTLLLFSADQSFSSPVDPLDAVPEDIFLKLRCLRVLDLSSVSIAVLPKSIGNLKHLRFLDLSLSRIKKLPESMASLYNMQTLRLRNCYELLELPRKLSNLVNLRHLDLHTEKPDSYSQLLSMPPRIGKLTCLQTLSRFIVGEKEGRKIGELKHLEDLGGSICISKLENVTDTEEVKEAQLKSKKHLQKLVLQWSTIIKDESIKDVLKYLEPHSNLKKLCIFQYGGIQFPSWVGDPSFTNLGSVYLQNCTNCTSLPPLGDLPVLKDLYIYSMPGVQHVGHEFCGNRFFKGFPSLEMLEFNDLPSLETWSGVGQGNFTCLRELEVADCPTLKEFPNLPPTLKTLSIQNCLGLTITPELKNLADLEFYRCSEEILKSLTGYPSLSTLTISGFPRLKTLSKVFSQSMLKLKRLYISYLDELTSLSEEDTPWDLPALERLVISHCPQLTSIPKELQNLNSLREFEIRDCSQLSSMPELGLALTLQDLCILNCPLLKR